MGKYRNGCRSFGCGGSVSPDEVIVRPTETIVNTKTKHRTVKTIHPTHVVNVNRTIVRNENFYPVTQETVNQTVVENYDCGSDINNPNCRRVAGASDNGNNGNNKHCCGRKGNWFF